MTTSKKYVFIEKTLFFPKEKIWVIGDLHLGWEKMLRDSGLTIPIKQFSQVQEELEKIIKNIKAKFGKIEQIVLLGDIKQHYGFEFEEKKEVEKLLRVLKQQVPEQNIIFIRGNHELNDKNGKYQDYFILKDIAFVHGHREFPEIYDKKINLIVMGHLHPSITLRDEMKIRNEKYKCFLVGRYRKKDFVVLPSFLIYVEGVASNEIEEIEGNSFSIIPNKELDNFETFVVTDIGEEPLSFGKLKDLE
jgi:putative SbcD/Mre11-related phosphoesterase